MPNTAPNVDIISMALERVIRTGNFDSKTLTEIEIDLQSILNTSKADQKANETIVKIIAIIRENQTKIAKLNNNNPT